ncbi:MAG: hypothetical protein E7313_07175 [Clostridiales bacterium]|nr:hypothetical protein [Clostridiales bacterium]
MKTILDITKEYLNTYPEEDYQINQGASLLLIQEDKIMFTLTKTNKWKKNEDITEIKFSGIGGALEKNESIFECLKREVKEEISLDIKEIDLPNLDEAFLVNNTEVLEKIKIGIDKHERVPLYIVRLKLPLREDTLEKNKKFSCLQLIVYVGKINSNTYIEISNEETIPGLLVVRGTMLKDLLDGKIILNSKTINNDIEIRWNKNFEQKLIPDKIKLIPQFTPIGLKTTELTFNDIKKIWKE